MNSRLEVVTLWHNTVIAVDHISADDKINVSAGPTKLVVRELAPMPKQKRSLLSEVDWRFWAMLVIVAATQVAVLVLFSLAPAAESLRPDALLRNPEKFRQIIMRRLEKAELQPSKKIETPKDAMNVLTQLGLSKESMGAARVLGKGSGLNDALQGLGTATPSGQGQPGLGTRGFGRGTVGTGNLAFGTQGKVGMHIDAGKIRYEGSLSRVEIQQVIDRFVAQIKYCYDREFQRDQNLEGKMVVHWTIAPDGTVANSKIVESTLANKEVEGCVLRVVNRMQFPAPRGGGIVAVTYPFVFSISGG